MGSDRITILCSRDDGGLVWELSRRGQAAVLEQGALASVGEPIPAGFAGKRGGLVTLALPASQVVTRIMTLPLVDADELSGAVALQVDKLSPFPVEQMVYSYEVLEKSAEESVVLIGMSQRSSVTMWGDALQKAGVAVARVDATALGYWQALQASGNLDASRRESFLLLGEDEVILLTHDAGRLISVSGLGRPENFSDSGVCEDFSDEVARILMEVDAECGLGENPVLVVMTSAARELDGLRAVLIEATGIEVRFAAGVAYPGAFSGLRQRCLRAGDAVPLLNLIPSEWVDQAASGQFRKRMIAAASAVFGVWFLLLAGGWGYMVWERARLNYLRDAEQQWLRPANAVRSMRLQVNMIDRYRDRTQSALECLREISSIQPEGVDLTSFTYRKGDGIELIGEADQGQLVLQFNQKLNESTLFGDVRPGTRTVTKQGRHRFSFEIKLGEGTP